MDDNKYLMSEAEIRCLRESLADAESEVFVLANALKERDGMKEEFEKITNSASWTFTKPLRFLGKHLRKSVSSDSFLAFLRLSRRFMIRVLDDPQEVLRLVKRGVILVLKGRFGELLSRLRRKLAPHIALVTHTLQFGSPLPEKTDSYDAWLEVNQWNERQNRYLLDRLTSAAGELPKLSMITPVYNTPEKYLKQMIRSVQQQVYQNWELCIVDDASTDPDVKVILHDAAESDSRIKFSSRTVNGGISAATNSAAAMATGDFLVFLDSDDLITRDASAEVALYISAHPETDWLYSDADKVDVNGKRYSPHFKPDWSPELLLSVMYCGQIMVIRRSLYEELGGMRQEFDGCQDHDLALRATEKARHVGHIPLVLYHWRAIPGSGAYSGNSKPQTFQAGMMAVQDAFRRRSYKGQVYQPDWAKRIGNCIYFHEFPDDGPNVTILLLTRNNKEMLKKCVESIEKTTYLNYELVIVDNNSDDPDTVEYLQKLPFPKLVIANPGERFDYSYLNNQAAQSVKSDYIIFLNDDTIVLEPRWLSLMIGYGQFPKVGAVGARLLFPDQRIQHAGVVHGARSNSLPDHALKNWPAFDAGYQASGIMPRNSIAVTAACMLTERDLFLQMGGFDQTHLPKAYQDADYCLRLSDNGYRCVYCPGAELYHLEGATKTLTDRPDEIVHYLSQYRDRSDPYYNPNFSKGPPPCFEIKPTRLVLGSITPIRTMMFTHNLNCEGAPYFELELAVGLKRRKVVDPIIVSTVDGPLRSAYEREDIKVKIIKPPKIEREVATYIESLSELCQDIASLEPELIHANTLQSWWMIDAAKMLKLPAVWNCHESEPWQTYFNFLPDQLADRAYDCFSYPYRLVFVAESTRRAWSPLESKHNYCVIPNGLNLKHLEKMGTDLTRRSARELLHVGSEDLVILLLGTICERKGQHDLPLALKILDERIWAKIRCFIVGYRESPETLKYNLGLWKILADMPLGLRDRIAVIPETPDVIKYYRAADIFVCTSRIESYPLVTLEAMAFGLPIITTPVFGLAEQVARNVNGLFYDPNEHKQLAIHIERLATDLRLRHELASNSRIVLEGLVNYDQMVDEYAKIFKEAFLSNGRTIKGIYT